MPADSHISESRSRVALFISLYPGVGAPTAPSLEQRCVSRPCCGHAGAPRGLPPRLSFKLSVRDRTRIASADMTVRDQFNDCEPGHVVSRDQRDQDREV